MAKTSKSKTTKSKKGGLNKKEKKEVSKIAKKAVLGLAESKYFHINGTIGEESFNAAWRISTGIQSEIAVLGFTTGFEKALNKDGSTTAYKYGVDPDTGSNKNMDSLELNRIFHAGSDVPNDQFQIEGKSIRPAYAESQWLLNRLAGNTNTLSQVQNGLIYKVRMVRVKPRPVKAAHIQVDPQSDLFLTNFNREFGVQSQLGSTYIFNPYEFMMAKVNTRKYRVLEDKTFTMGPGGNYVNLGAGEELLIPYQVQVGETSSVKTLKIKHNIGKELYYDHPNGTNDEDQYPQDGFVLEFILFHVWAQGNPNEEFALRTTPDLLRLSCRPVSTFKDI